MAAVAGCSAELDGSDVGKGEDTVEPDGATSVRGPAAVPGETPVVGGGIKVPECFASGEILEPQANLSDSFARRCAGCHGKQGQGQGDFPSVPGVLSLDEFLAVVRDGRGELMPAFGEGRVPIATLVADYATLSGAPAPVPEGAICEEDEAPLSEEDYRQLWRDGLAGWREPSRVHGGSCADCHGPAPFDLARIGYDDATILRRALKHVPQSAAEAVIDLVGGMRRQYGFQPGSNFHDFRPFQPGGVVLGQTSLDYDARDQYEGPEDAPAIEADHLFGRALAAALPTIAGPPITSIEQAERARDEYLAINPRDFPIAYALNRWTEDSHHGESHASVNEWIPDFPLIPNDHDALYALHDAYLAAPKVETLLAIYDAMDELTNVVGDLEGFDKLDAERFYRARGKAVLLAQHHFWAEMNGQPGLAELKPSAELKYKNAMWDAGDVVRLVRNTESTFPDEIMEGLSSSRTPREENRAFITSWFWAGWLFDPTLYNTSQSNSTKSSEYFTEMMYVGGYYNHLTYQRVRKNLATAYEFGSQEQDEYGPLGIIHSNSQNWGYFLAYGRGETERWMPPAGEKRDLYIRLLGNSTRMMKLLLEAEGGVLGEGLEKFVVTWDGGF